MARSVSPLTDVRVGLPPILSIPCDQDPIMPYAQNVRLRDALIKAGVSNESVTIPGGGHGNFKPEERIRIYLKIREFLASRLRKNTFRVRNGKSTSRLEAHHAIADPRVFATPDFALR